MRRYALSLFALLTAFNPVLKGQAISNSGFEMWSDIQYYEEPVGYTTTNVVTYYAGDGANVTKSTDAYSGSYALRLETIDGSDGVVEGAAFIGKPAEGSFTGGIPYDDRPDSLTGYVKYNVAENDTAYVAAIFKKFGVPIGVSFGQFTGVQNSYQYFSIQVEWLVPIISPDTLAIALISSSIFAEPVAGNVLFVDDIQFVGTAAPFPNGDFEDWIDLSAEEPDDWRTTNVFTIPASSTSVSKSTDSHSGSYAAKIESQVTNWGDTLGFITNGYIADDGPAGGMPVEDIPAMLTGYYKYAPTGQDTALAGLTLYHYNPATGSTDVLENAFIKLPPASDYTYFEIQVDYYSLPEPDTVNIAFGSGNFDEPGAFIGLGSTLIVDDIDITFKPHIVSVADQPAGSEAKIYPNPVRETLFIEIKNVLHQPAELVLFNAEGHIVYSKTIRDPGVSALQVDPLPAGLYFYRLNIGRFSQKGKFIVE